MRSRRLPLKVLWPAALLVLVGTLAWLQYRWLGQVSEAERDRLQTTLKQRAAEFADDFDREIAALYVAFQPEGAPVDPAAPGAFARRYDAWRASARVPEIVRGIYLFDAARPDELRRYRPDHGDFAPAAWPAALERIRPSESLSAGMTAGIGGAILATARYPLVPSIPALVIALPRVDAPAPDQPFAVTTVHLGGDVLIVELDRQAIAARLLPMLADRYFAAHGVDGYRLAVIDRADPSDVEFSRGLADGARIDPAHADATVGVFALRPSLLGQAATAASAGNAGTPAPSVTAATAGTGQFKFFVEQRSMIVREDGASVTGMWQPAEAVGEPAWTLVLQHASGSLEAAVDEARRRNLALSFGILAVLAVGTGLVAINAQRAERLVAQQMQFVATVSHELRTPLAVIRSAAQNLSAGVVQEAAQARRYGELIDVEGKRLTDMVEQVLEFAGLAARQQPAATRPTDIVALIKDVAVSCDALCRESRVALHLEIDASTPRAAVDPGAMRRVLQNLVANAVKYGASGGWVRLAVAPDGGRGGVQVAVSDGGAGIDPADLPHIFEPFYRGRDAVDRQVHGNGLGLSLVKRIVDVHGGRVEVQSTPGEGTTFTLHLPAARPDAAVEAVGGAAARGDSIA